MNFLRITVLTTLFVLFACVSPLFAQEVTSEAPDSALQTFTSKNGDAAIRFPADWIVKDTTNEESLITLKLGNNKFALEKDLFDREPIFNSGEIHLEVSVVELTKLIKMLPANTLTINATPMDIIDVISKQGMPDEFTFGKPGATSINNNPTVRMNLTAGKRGEGQLLLTIIDNKWVVAIILYAASGEGDKWDVIARDIIASAKFKTAIPVTPEVTPELLELTQTISLTHGFATFSYPDKWFSRQSEYEGIYLANTKAALDKSFGSPIESGEVNILLTITTTQDYIDQKHLVVSDDATFPEILQAMMKYADPEAMIMRGKQAAHLDYQGDDFEGITWLVEVNEGVLIVVQMLAAPGEAQRWKPTVVAIIESALATP